MRKRGDRWDGVMLRDLDPMHFVMPLIYPNRCDNEAFIQEMIDLRPAMAFLEEKNKNNSGYHYNVFQLIVTAALKTVMLRPKMNRFIANRTMYQRRFLSAAFTVKKEFKDSSDEGLAFLYASRGDTLDTVHDRIYEKISTARSDEGDSSSNTMDIFNRMPRFLSRAIIKLCCVLDRHGRVPRSFVATDPYYASIVLTNLGSIGQKSCYHHLTNWGTNSLFIAIGRIKERPFLNKNNETEMRMSVDLGVTIDERLADGYYYAKTVRLMKHLLEHPELLEDRLDSHELWVK